MSPSASSLLLLQLLSLVLMVVAMPTCQLRGNVVQEAHNLLRDMGGPLPVHCLQYNSVVSFPSSALPAGSGRPQCRRTLWVVYETLKGAGQVFEDNEVPVGEGGVSWDSQKLDNFQNLLYRLVEDGSCLSRVNGSEVLSSYFSNLTSVLQQQGSAGCGWLLLRRDLLLALRSGLQQHHLSCFS
ncbi:interferon alpha-1-like [Myripristis murdjan]|uniref:interferon alpha-1-like n=1 Tax=Myripristis murdjan TaxID=586833 RepID=UPI0011762008|nr:interferon alpha-1-like [Myripristis murdjan]